MRSLSALRASAPLVCDPCRRCAPPRLLYPRPARRLFLGGVAVQAVGMGRIDAEDLHLVGEGRKVLQRPRHVAVLGVALHVGMEPGGNEVPPLERGTPV